ncbi:MAG TPA: MotA/TolQ/ExbB proton channel family protein [Phycisphaerales bacterium]|nr:MotA/TolQ/ExbB proton channel family protein [Phycisphaerales bacterium]
MTSVMILGLAQAPGAAAGGGSIVTTVWDMAVRGGWTMVPLALCSLLAMTIVVERLILTRRRRVAPPALIASIESLRRTPDQALARFRADPSPAAAVLATAARVRALPRPQQETAIAEAGEREVRKLRQRMRVLSSLPQVATMLGLLGTVIGMIRTFTVIAASGESLGKTERLAQGIHEAWTATAAGLIIAIPTLLAFHFVMGRIDAAAAALDHAARLWLEGDESAAVAPTPAVAAAAPLPAIPATANGELVASA